MTQEKREFEDWLSCARQAKRVALPIFPRTGHRGFYAGASPCFFGAGQAG